MSGSSIDHLPHVDELPHMSREELISKYEPLEIEIRDIRDEIKRLMALQLNGLPIDEERFRKMRYGKQLRERMQIKIASRIQQLKRDELGGNPQAILHRRFLHAVFDAVKQLPDVVTRDAIFLAARTQRNSPGCEHCAMHKSGHIQGSNGVAQHVDPEHTESPVVRRLDEANLVPPTLAGNEDQR